MLTVVLSGVCVSEGWTVSLHIKTETRPWIRLLLFLVVLWCVSTQTPQHHHRDDLVRCGRQSRNAVVHCGYLHQQDFMQYWVCVTVHERRDKCASGAKVRWTRGWRFNTRVGGAIGGFRRSETHLTSKLHLKLCGEHRRCETQPGDAKHLCEVHVGCTSKVRNAPSLTSAKAHRRSKMHLRTRSLWSSHSPRLRGCHFTPILPPSLRG